MPQFYEVFDGANHKYDPAGSSLTAETVQAAIDELDAKPAPPADLTDAEFPTYAVFDAKNVAAAAAVNFASGNVYEIDATTYPNITVQAPTGHPGKFTLKILNSASLVSLTSAAEGAIQWAGSTAPSWAGTTSVYFAYDGSTWEASANVNVG